jgi:uncharacterized protein YjbI with pentapeptide repeats
MSATLNDANLSGAHLLAPGLTDARLNGASLKTPPGPVGQNCPTGKRIGASGAATANAQKRRCVVYIARRRLITSPRNG